MLCPHAILVVAPAEFGGRHVAKILVADDNSNVQKTVALALADLGVEVIAVNNGDAAVKRLPDVAPDLVLADIFMPVRNGYEVCDYVKKDSRFSHIPVVLLVGAFDPLDEREAQRVGADGILKKPFVPPDPLIAMIKTLLERSASERLVAVAASKPAAAMQGKNGGVAVAEEHPPAPQAAQQISEPEEEIHKPVDRVSFGEGERPIAFGQLLDPPAQDSASTEMEAIEPVDDAQILTSARDASLGEPAFWKTEDPEPEAQDEDANTDAETDDSSALAMHAWKGDEESSPRRAASDFLAPVEPFELVRDEDESAKPSASVASSASILQDAASQAPLTVESAKPSDLAANPIEWMASVRPPRVDEPAEDAPESGVSASDSADIAGSDDVTNASAPAAPISAPAHETPEFELMAHAPANSPAQKAEDTARSIPVQEWADLASSAQSNSMNAATEKAAASHEARTNPPAANGTATPQAASNFTPPVSKPSPQSAEDTARSIPKQDWADMAASLQPRSSEATSEKRAPANVQSESAPTVPAIAENGAMAAEGSASIAAPDPALVEAVVQRVLDKMRPQVVDIITKEFLRPVVQALVHREITKR